MFANKKTLIWHKREEKLPKDGAQTLCFFEGKDQVFVSQFCQDIHDGKPGWVAEWYERSDIQKEDGSIEKGGYGFWPFVTHWASIPHPTLDDVTFD